MFGIKKHKERVRGRLATLEKESRTARRQREDLARELLRLQTTVMEIAAGKTKVVPKELDRNGNPVSWRFVSTDPSDTASVPSEGVRQ
jgi:hypothetical protein